MTDNGSVKWQHPYPNKSVTESRKDKVQRVNVPGWQSALHSSQCFNAVGRMTGMASVLWQSFTSHSTQNWPFQKCSS